MKSPIRTGIYRSGNPMHMTHGPLVPMGVPVTEAEKHYSRWPKRFAAMLKGEK